MTLALQKCPLCFSPQIRFWGKTSGTITLHDQWSRCDSCSVVFANPIKSIEEVENFYKKSFYEINQLENELDTLQPLYRWLTNLLKKYNPSAKSIMEIGCGRGSFLTYFSTHFPISHVTGIEFDSRVTSKIELTCESRFQNDYYEKIHFDKKFDLIVSWHVIEHVFDVNHFVQKIHADLNSNGVVIIGTPVFGWLNELKAYLQQMKGRTVSVGTSSDHTYFFTKKILANIFTKNGFEVKYHRIYIDNVNGELDFSKNLLKATILSTLRLVMSITGFPLFGKQILVAKKIVLAI
jgi:2-polyprenyl-3-methyl-5-hydroxy-6-metoxy-1,4-benzoquinol methylase